MDTQLLIIIILVCCLFLIVMTYHLTKTLCKNRIQRLNSA